MNILFMVHKKKRIFYSNTDAQVIKFLTKKEYDSNTRLLNF